ncbi:hypothetical protein P171DRAFT_240630 [Karstenula rhodostoma CBS 690.94]|uniref:Uncharacterized protein n=1 Tax=Karstenula rhodostoma CBS 690.94 TaxID=1392251 RepID=A0A9P4PMT0_9PLEO|nr:hypothetical protein P171DRAFT_240630 [Karstenula rhodostoma CBS 690.94]
MRTAGRLPGKQQPTDPLQHHPTPASYAPPARSVSCNVNPRRHSLGARNHANGHAATEERRLRTGVLLPRPYTKSEPDSTAVLGDGALCGNTSCSSVADEADAHCPAMIVTNCSPPV